MTVGERRVGWKDRIGDETVCVRCGETRDSTDVDRMLWCDECRARTRQRAVRVGLLGGVTTALLLAWYIWEAIQPSNLVIGGWLACIVAGGWIAAKIIREVAYGVLRSLPEETG